MKTISRQPAWTNEGIGKMLPKLDAASPGEYCRVPAATLAATLRELKAYREMEGGGEDPATCESCGSPCCGSCSFCHGCNKHICSVCCEKYGHHGNGAHGVATKAGAA